MTRSCWLLVAEISLWDVTVFSRRRTLHTERAQNRTQHRLRAFLLRRRAGSEGSLCAELMEEIKLYALHRHSPDVFPESRDRLAAHCHGKTC